MDRPRKVIVEWRFKPDLAFYGAMDTFASDLQERYPHWERSPLTLQVWDARRHRRVHFGHNRWFFESDDFEDIASELSEAQRHIRTLATRLGTTSLVRLGIRQFYAIDVGLSFSALTDRLAERFGCTAMDLPASLQDPLRDIGLVLDFDSREGWKYNFRAGPMLKPQFFQVVSFEPKLYEDDTEDSARSFQSFQASIPEQFLFIDVDCFAQEIEHDLVEELVSFSRDKVARIAADAKRACIEED